MIKFLLRILVFLSMMFILDRGFGVAMKYLEEHAKGGYVGHHNYILHQSNEDILIFGSSRAIHHYNPQIIVDSFGMSCYNCGQDGNGIVLFYGWWQIIKNRHLPKMIIYDVNPSFDLLVGEDNSKYLGWLRSEYDNTSIINIFDGIDKTEKYKMQSMLYRYNSSFLQVVVDYIHPVFQIPSNGYLPLKGNLDKMKIKKNRDNENKCYAVDTLKVSYLEKLIREIKSKDVKLYFSVSPIWYGMDNQSLVVLKKLCAKNDVLLLDYSNDSQFVKKDIMFKDGNHLNSFGADVYTSLLSEEILNNQK